MFVSVNVVYLLNAFLSGFYSANSDILSAFLRSKGKGY